jgi:hypothetical protein
VAEPYFVGLSDLAERRGGPGEKYTASFSGVVAWELTKLMSYKQRKAGKDLRIGQDDKALVFVSYSRKDAELMSKLMPLLMDKALDEIAFLYIDTTLIPGEEWASSIESNLKHADVVLLLLTPAFLASDYCMNKELPLAMEQQKKGGCIVMPILLADCDYQDHLGKHDLPVFSMIDDRAIGASTQESRFKDFQLGLKYAVYTAFEEKNKEVAYEEGYKRSLCNLILYHRCLGKAVNETAPWLMPFALGLCGVTASVIYAFVFGREIRRLWEYPVYFSAVLAVSYAAVYFVAKRRLRHYRQTEGLSEFAGDVDWLMLWAPPLMQQLIIIPASLLIWGLSTQASFVWLLLTSLLIQALTVDKLIDHWSKKRLAIWSDLKASAKYKDKALLVDVLNDQWTEEHLGSERMKTFLNTRAGVHMLVTRPHALPKIRTEEKQEATTTPANSVIASYKREVPDFVLKREPRVDILFLWHPEDARICTTVMGVLVQQGLALLCAVNDVNDLQQLDTSKEYVAIIPLLTQHFVGSALEEACVQTFFKREVSSNMQLCPVLCDDVEMGSSPFSSLQMLPGGNKPLLAHDDIDTVCDVVIKAIFEVCRADYDERMRKIVEYDLEQELGPKRFGSGEGTDLLRNETFMKKRMEGIFHEVADRAEVWAREYMGRVLQEDETEEMG